MRYLPDLIPKQFRVLPDYFKGHQFDAPVKKRTNLIAWILGVICLVLAVPCIVHPLLFLLLAGGYYHIASRAQLD